MPRPAPDVRTHGRSACVIVVITTTEKDARGVVQTIASHGIHDCTDEIVTLQPLPPALLGAKMDDRYGEWILPCRCGEA